MLPPSTKDHQRKPPHQSWEAEVLIKFVQETPKIYRIFSYINVTAMKMMQWIWKRARMGIWEGFEREKERIKDAIIL